MGKKSKDNTHGQNSLEAAADKTVGGLNAMKEQVQETNKTPRGEQSQGPGMVRGQESVGDQAADAVGAAAGALGAVIPEANKEEVENSTGRVPADTSKIAGPPKNGGASGSESGLDRAQKKGQQASEHAESAVGSLVAGAHERAEATAQKMSELFDDGKEALQQKSGEAREGARQAEQRAEEGGREAKDKINRGAEQAAERTKNGVESAKEGAERLGQRAAEKGREVKEAVVGGADADGLDRASLERAKRQAHENTGAQLSKGLHRPQDGAIAAPKDGSSGSKAEAAVGKAKGAANSSRDEAEGAARTAKEDAKGAARSAKAEAKGAANAVTDTVKSAYRDAKDAVSDTYNHAEDKARSALENLRDRLERVNADMETHNFVEDSMSRGYIPSNTQDVLAAGGRN